MSEAGLESGPVRETARSVAAGPAGPAHTGLAPVRAACRDVHVDLFVLRAQVATLLRDFDAASAALDQAEALDPASPYTAVGRASLLATQDSHEEALAAAQEALARRPWCRSAVQLAASLL